MSVAQDTEGVDSDVIDEEIYNFLDNLKGAVDAQFEVSAKFNRIVICGMGGSAIGGDIIKDCVINDLDCPITVQRFPELPKWMDENTFVIISSYSGNTNETLIMYHQAMEKGCTILILTAGGQLKELGEKNGNYVVLMAKGLQPRSALGLNLGYLANIIDRVCGTKCRAEIRKLLPSLYKLRDKLCDTDGEAYRIAKDINGKVPIIYATAGIYATAIRWKSQINENSKTMAFAGSVPEFNHNEISGWSEGGLRSRCVPVFLYEVSAPREIRKMADASIAALENYAQDICVVRIKGKTVLERTLRAVIMGDYVSLYLAHFAHVDPMDIKSINDFKNRLNETIAGNKPKKSKKTK